MIGTVVMMLVLETHVELTHYTSRNQWKVVEGRDMWEERQEEARTEVGAGLAQLAAVPEPAHR